MITLTRYFSIGIRYLEITFIPALLLVAIVGIYQMIRHHFSMREVFHHFNIIKLIRIWYILFVLLVVFKDRPSVFREFVNLSIFSLYKEAIIDFSPEIVLNIILNILLFVPFGFLFSSCFKKRNSWLVLLLGLVFTVIIELTQYYFSVGVLDVDDVINNFWGVLIGHCLYELIAILRHPKKPTMNIKIASYGLLILLPLIIFGGVYAEYLLKDYGNLAYEYYYGQHIRECDITFEGDSFHSIDDEIPVYKVKPGTEEDSFDIAKRLFCCFDTGIGDSYYYDDCVVIYNSEHNLCLWYYYDTATYSLSDLVEKTLSESEATNVTSVEVTKALGDLNIEIPQDSDFSFIGDGKFKFVVNMRNLDSEILDGSATCVYYDSRAHEIEYDILKLTETGSLEKATIEDLTQRIMRGDFYLADESLYQVKEDIDSIIVSDVSIDYIVDTKGFYHPVYKLTTHINGNKTILYIDA